MKKFLLSLAMVLGICAAASAESVTLPGADKVWENYTWTQDGDNYKGTVEGYSLVLEKNTSTTALVKPDQYSIRIYAGAQLHITAPEGVTFSKVEVTINSNGNKATEASAEGWTVSAFDGGKFTMTAATPQSTITFDGAGKQLRVASMVITTGEAGEDPNPTPDPTPDPVGDGVVVDFSTDANADLLPSAESETATDATIDGVDFTFVNCKAGNYQGKYLQISGKNYTGKAYMDFTLPIDTKSITIHTGNNASTNVTVTLSAVNGDAIVSDLKLDAKDADFTFNIPAAYQAKGTALRLATSNAFNAQISKMTFSGEAGEVPPTPPTPPTPDTKDYTVINTMVAGDYVIAAGEHAMDQLPESKKYGYPGVVAATFADDVLTTAAPVFKFETATGGYYIKCADGRYLYQTGNYNSFNVSDTPSDEGIFTVTLAADGTATITNTNVNKTLAYDSEFNSFGSYPEVGDRELPKLYIGKGTGLAEIATEEAPVEYFNLQGVRINEPAAGQVVIRRQGNKVSKIFVK